MKKDKFNKQNKQGSFSIVTGAIILLATLAALLFLTGQFGSFFAEAGDKSVCMMSFQAAAMTKTAGKTGTKLDCDINKINLTLNNLIKKRASVEKYINNYNGEPFLYKAQDQSNSEDHTLEYALDKEIADEMISAWQTAGAGRLDLFSNWDDYVLKVPNTGEWNVGKYVPKHCVIFSRIRFDQDLEDHFKNKEINSLNEWLKKNTVPWNNVITQYDYLSDDGQKMLYGIQYPYKVDAQDPLAIVFMRINIKAGDEIMSWIDKHKSTVAAISVVGGCFTIIGCVPGVMAGTTAIATSSLSDADAPTAKSYIVLMPYSKVTEVCTQIEN